MKAFCSVQKNGDAQLIGRSIVLPGYEYLLKMGFFFFVGFISFAPSFYLIMPISSVVRSIRMYEVLFALIFILVLIQSIKNKGIVFHITPIDFPVFVIVIFWAVSILKGNIAALNINPRDYISLLKPVRLWLILQMVLFFAVNRRDVHRILYILILFSLYPEILGIFEYLNNTTIKEFLCTAYVGQEYSPIIVGGFDVYGAGYLHKFRSSSVFVGDVNAYGGYAAIFFLAAYLFFLYVRKNRDKYIFLAISGASLVGVLISGSRKAILCIFIGIILCAILRFRRFLNAWPIYIMSAAVTLSLIPEYFVQRLFEHPEQKIVNIDRLWMQFANQDITTLLLGTGALFEYGMDNFYMMLLFRCGLIGLLLYIVLIAIIINSSYYVMRNAHCWLDEMVGLMGVVLTISNEWLNVTGLYTYSGRISESLWVILGTVFVLYRFIRIENRSINAPCISF
jgi:hypothetical protein